MVPSAGTASMGGYVSRRALSTTSSVSMGKLQKFKDKFILSEADAHKRPSDLEIAKKKLPRNTPTLAERVKRDSAGPLWVPDRHSGYHKGLTGTWRDYVDPNATAMDIVKDSLSGWKVGSMTPFLQLFHNTETGLILVHLSRLFHAMTCSVF